MNSESMDHILYSYGIVPRGGAAGCGKTEINLLERKYGLVLPKSYKNYLSTIGKYCGKLFECDNVRALYQDALNLTSDFKSELKPSNEFNLHENALIIATRMEEQYIFIECNGNDNPPVLYFNVWDWKIREFCGDIREWVKNSCIYAASQHG